MVATLRDAHQRTMHDNVEKLRSDQTLFSARALQDLTFESLSDDLDNLKAELSLWGQDLEHEVPPEKSEDLRSPCASGFAGGLVMGTQMMALALRFNHYPTITRFKFTLDPDQATELRIQSVFRGFNTILRMASAVAQGQLIFADSDKTMLNRSKISAMTQCEERLIVPLDHGNPGRFPGLTMSFLDFGIDLGVKETLDSWIQSKN